MTPFKDTISITFIATLALLAFGRASLADDDDDDHLHPYVLGGGGCVKSSQQSNSDEIEFGSECGVWYAVEVGFAWDLNEAGTVSLGGELSQTHKDLHGQNGRSKQTADGNRLDLSASSIVARYEHDIYGPVVKIYVMGGAGVGYARGLGESDFVPVVQAEAGLALGLAPQLDLGAGYRYRKVFGLDLDGNRGDPDFHGPWAWARWSFE